MVIEQIIKEFFESEINENNEYKIELYDDILNSYNQEENWLRQVNATKIAIAQNNKRVVIRITPSQVSSIENMLHTSFNWYMDVYARADDETIVGDLWGVIGRNKDKVLTSGSFRYFLTFLTPQPKIAEIDNGVYMRQINFSGSGIISNNGIISNEITFKLGGNELKSLLAWNSAFTATGDAYQLPNSFETETDTQSYANSLKLRLVAIPSDVVINDLINISLGDTLLTTTKLEKAVVITRPNKVINWNKAKIIGISTENEKGGIMLLTVDIVKG